MKQKCEGFEIYHEAKFIIISKSIVQLIQIGIYPSCRSWKKFQLAQSHRNCIINVHWTIFPNIQK
jgi:hypothetical protein